MSRGYHPDFVEAQFDKVRDIPRDRLLRPQATHRSYSSRRFPSIVDFNPALPDIGKIIAKHLPVLHTSPSLKNLFPERAIFGAFRKCKSLKDHLRNPNIKDHHRPIAGQTTSPTQGRYKCTRRRCDLCANFLLPSTKFHSSSTNKFYPVVDSVSCDSRNVVYLATCVKCNVQYAGSSSTEFKVGFRNHKSDMVNGRKRCELAIHFSSTPHSLKDIKFIIIEKIHFLPIRKQFYANGKVIGWPS